MTPTPWPKKYNAELMDARFISTLTHQAETGQVRLQIAASCKRTIECLELQSYTEAGDPDKDAGYDHMNDALGYLVYRDFSMLHARAGRGTGIRLY